MLQVGVFFVCMGERALPQESGPGTEFKDHPAGKSVLRIHFVSSGDLSTNYPCKDKAVTIAMWMLMKNSNGLPVRQPGTLRQVTVGSCALMLWSWATRCGRLLSHTGSSSDTAASPARWHRKWLTWYDPNLLCAYCFLFFF